MSDDHIQGTQAWVDSRLGKVTASRIGDLFTKARKGSKESAMRANYRAQLVCEIMTGKVAEEQFVSWDMKRGMELEPLARAEYEMREGEIVHTSGFREHPTIPRFGASPDGLIGDGMVQFKCVKTAHHLEYLMGKIVPIEYRPQMYAEMAVTGRLWSDFCSYDPNLPSPHQLFVARLKRDDAEIELIENEVRKFNAEVDGVIARLNGTEDLTGVLEQSLADLR